MLAHGFLPSELSARLDERVFARWREAEASGELAGLGERLRALGLDERAVRHVCGTGHPLTAPHRAPLDAAWQPPLGDVPPAALMARFWVAGAHLETQPLAQRLGADFERLVDLGLIHAQRARSAATVCMVPLGQCLVVSDRADVRFGRDVALIADESALLTIGALPARAAKPGLSWLDVGTGSAIVPLSRPGVAAHILGTDINQRALVMARLGAALSRVAHLELERADLFDGLPSDARFDRITFNAPIPDGAHDADEARVADELPWYRYGAEDILSRFWSGVAARVTDDAEVVVHSVLPEDGFPAYLAGLPGQVTVVRYTPPGHVPGFGVTAWRPLGTRRYVLGEVMLTPSTPHISRTMLGLDAACE